LQGADDDVVKSLRRGDLLGAPITVAERRLLEFVRLLTNHAYRATADDVQQLRESGWSDEQIAEAVYITALFAMFNRVADAFGLKDPNYFDIPPEAQPKSPSPVQLE
jgi:alkylhydroperoxidase family enzyme